MQELNKLKAELDNIDAESANKTAQVMEKARVIFEKLMKGKEKEVNELVEKVNNTKELTTVNHDEHFHQWIRVDFTKFIDLDDKFQRQLLTEYFQDNHCMEVDLKNDCLTMSIGPAIIINDDGDVLDQDSGSWFIKKSEYESEVERNGLIEKYMEKNGYFPSVLRVDNYGNAFYVNTKEKKGN